ncbi:MAG: antibiotic biosynthesis monooxygenase [Thaumarchaeota archaeon]|nr:antibiotic biosynthesis monooxygenase [Nitrososphaerota archaeon]
MVLISKSGNVTTAISHFKIDSEYQKKQVDLLREFIDDTLSRQPGFVSSTIHKSSKGSNIINYSQWADLKGHNVTINHIASPEPRSVLSFATHELDSYEITRAIGDDIKVTEHNKAVTSIIYVKLDPIHQVDFTSGWLNIFENVIKKQPGFISAILHKSATGNRLLSYSQWQNREDLAAMFALPEVFISADRVAQFSRTDWDTYEVSHIREI